ncbi:MAG: hypothetical protein ACE5MM_04975 [Nitrospiraceae bacterium]
MIQHPARWLSAWLLEEATMDGLVLFGMMAVMLGIIGLIIRFKGEKK